MTNIDIKALLQSVISGQMETETALSQIKDESDFELACDICHEEITPAYDQSGTDLGDAWAKLLRDVKIHAITSLEEPEKMKFIAQSLD